MLFDIYEDLPDSISYIFDELDKHNIFYWIDAGTLLKGMKLLVIFAPSLMPLTKMTKIFANEESCLRLVSATVMEV